MPSSSRRKNCTYGRSLHKCFSAGPSGGNVLVPARTLRRSRLRGRCRQSRPPKNPPAALTNCVRIFRFAMGGSVEKSLKDTVSLRGGSSRSGHPSPSSPPWLPLWGSCHEVTERVNTPSPPLRGTSPIGRGKWPSSVTAAPCHLPRGGRLRKRIVTGGNPWKGPHQRARWFAMTYSIRQHPKESKEKGPGSKNRGLGRLEAQKPETWIEA